MGELKFILDELRDLGVLFTETTMMTYGSKRYFAENYNINPIRFAGLNKDKIIHMILNPETGLPWWGNESCSAHIRVIVIEKEIPTHDPQSGELNSMYKS